MLTEDDTRAQARAGGLPRPVASTEHRAMRKAAEVLHGHLKPSQVPSRPLLGTRLDMIEENEPIALPLSQITGSEIPEEDFLASSVDSAGIPRFRRGNASAPAPGSAEDLRAVYEVYAFILLALPGAQVHSQGLAGRSSEVDLHEGG